MNGDVVLNAGVNMASPNCEGELDPECDHKRVWEDCFSIRLAFSEGDRLV